MNALWLSRGSPIKNQSAAVIWFYDTRGKEYVFSVGIPLRDTVRSSDGGGLSTDHDASLEVFWARKPRGAQKMLERLYMSSGSGMPWNPQGETGKRCWGERHLDYLAYPAATASKSQISGRKWVDGWLILVFALVFTWIQVYRRLCPETQHRRWHSPLI